MNVVSTPCTISTVESEDPLVLSSHVVPISPLPVFIQPQIARRCRNPFWRIEPQTGTIVRLRCARSRCSVECRWRWRMKMRKRLFESLNARPIRYEIRLTSKRVTDDKLLSAAHSRFFKSLRRQFALDYWSINEWSRGRRHLHAIIRVPGEIEHTLVADFWRQAILGENASSHIGAVRDQIAIATYLTKLEELPPQSFRGRLFNASRSFWNPH